MINVENLTKIYGEGESQVVALDNVSCNIQEGKFVAIIGKSGSGKSTLLNMIGALETPTKGEVTIGGENLIDMNKNQLAKWRNQNMGYVFQAFYVEPEFSVLDNVGLPLLIANVDKAERDQRAKECIIQLGLQDKINEKVKNLSGGQKQRVAIARALALNPKVLLCDEATSALDPNTTKSILSLLQDINKKLNITIIMVTHQMEVIKQICSRVAIMEGGKVLEIGNTEQLFLQNSKNLQKLVGEDEIVLPKGSNIRIIFPKEISNESIITSMARNLDIDFSIVCGRLEKYREDILGSLIINVSSKHKEKVKKYLDERHVRWEEIINED